MDFVFASSVQFVKLPTNPPPALMNPEPKTPVIFILKRILPSWKNNSDQAAKVVSSHRRKLKNQRKKWIRRIYVLNNPYKRNTN